MRRWIRRRASARAGPGIRERIARLFRAIFSGPAGGEWDDDPRGGGIGVREPRRPLRPSMSGGVALEAPPSERTDVRAVGEEERD